MILDETVPGLRFRDLHEMMHLLVTGKDVIQGLERTGFKRLGLLNLPFMETEVASLFGFKAPLTSIMSGGQGPIRRLLFGQRKS